MKKKYIYIILFLGPQQQYCCMGGAGKEGAGGPTNYALIFGIVGGVFALLLIVALMSFVLKTKKRTLHPSMYRHMIGEDDDSNMTSNPISRGPRFA